MAKDWRVLFDKDTEVKIQVEAGDSTGRHKKRRCEVEYEIISTFNDVIHLFIR